jgi:hypothetical protein
MLVKITQSIKLSLKQKLKLRELVNQGELKITKGYLSKIINEKVVIPQDTYTYLLSKV